MEIKQILKESSDSDKLAKLISKSIETVDDSLAAKTFAIAVAKVLEDDYGTHNYKDFINQLKKSLN